MENATHAPTPETSVEGLQHIPAHLQIKVLHVDSSIIVIAKPCHLRSVPGHATPPPPDKAIMRPKKRPRNTQQVDVDAGTQRTAQEAWAAAIESFAHAGDDTVDVDDSSSATELTNHDFTKSFLKRLSETRNTSAIPRKWKLFWKYVQRSRQRLVAEEVTEDEVEPLVKNVYELIRTRQERYMNLPEPTPHEESALGQLRLMGYGDLKNKSSPPRGIHVVHRLDCETSGVMVFARTENAASFLCQAWREREKVEKLYLARVQSWPPFHDKQQREGVIDVPLAPSKERLKWEVRTDGTGKESITKWKVKDEPDKESSDPAVFLELSPVTGRTHQLRIHCAAVGGGICGDSLYGDNKVEWKEDKASCSATDTMLNLHAHILRFPHPETSDVVEFVSPPPW